MLTLDEIQQRMLHEWEIDDILLFLQVSAEELLQRFDDRIEENYDRLNEEFENDETSE